MINIKKEIDRTSRRIKEELIKRGYNKATLKDLRALIYCRIYENYKNMYNTKLYNKYSVEYCIALEILEKYFQ